MEPLPFSTVLVNNRQNIVKLVSHLIRMQTVGDIVTFEITFSGDAIVVIKLFACILTQYGEDFIIPEQIVFSLHAVTVGILRRVKSALRGDHLPEHIVRCFLSRIKVPGISSYDIGCGICQNQQSVVIQHLLKMWRQEITVSGIPGEPVADMIENATLAH